MSLYGYKVADAGHSCICDLRSDTMTQPDFNMRQAMMEAPLGDDVYGEDPTVRMLEETLADKLGKEAALFFPTGTQSNLAAIMAHCGRGDEVIVGDCYHVFCDEAAGASVLAGISMLPAKTDEDGGISASTVKSCFKVDDPHYARSCLLSLENTVGGRVVPLERIVEACNAARECGLATHLDGARFFNAITALGCDAKKLAAPFDSVSICLSKGLGAPVGSVLVASIDIISKAKRNRKILGGSMRQSGVLAAAGLYALEHNLGKLVEDQAKAFKLARVLTDLGIGQVHTQTNMIFLTPAVQDHARLISHMAQAGIKIGGQAPTIRMVVHQDVSDEGIDAAIEAFRSFLPSAKD